MLKLHENLDENKKLQIQRDFGIPQDNDELFVSERLALIWMIKKKWYIDDRSPDKKNFDKNEKIIRFFKFELINKDMIEKLQN